MIYEQLWEKFKAEQRDSVIYWMKHDLAIKHDNVKHLPEDGDWGSYLYDNQDTLRQEFDVERIGGEYLLYPYAFGHSMTHLDPMHILLGELK